MVSSKFNILWLCDSVGCGFWSYRSHYKWLQKTLSNPSVRRESWALPTPGKTWLNPSTPCGVSNAHSLCLLKEVPACGRRVGRKTKPRPLPVWWFPLRRTNICRAQGTSCRLRGALLACRGQEMKTAVVSGPQTGKKLRKTKSCCPPWRSTNNKGLK